MKKWYFANTVCITVSNTFFITVRKCSKDCFVTVGEFCIFWITVLHSVQILFSYCWDRVENYFFFFCLRDFEQVIDCLQHVLSRVRSGNLLSAALRACEIACNAPPSSTMKGFFFPQQQLQFAWLRWSCGDWWHEVARDVPIIAFP